MLTWLTENFVIGILLITVVLLLRRAWPPSPAAEHCLWLLVLIKLALPPLVYWPFSLAGVLPPWPADAGSAATTRIIELPSERLAPSVVAAAPPLEAANVAVEDWDPVGAVAPTPTAAEQERRTVPGAWAALNEAPPPPKPKSVVGFGWTPGLAWFVVGGWIIGAVIAAARHVVRICRLQACLRRAQLAPSWLVEDVRRQAERLQVAPPAVLVISGCHSPCLWCLGRPRLLVPAGLLAALPPARWRCIIVHELAHLARRDHWWRWGQLAAGCIWWWQPLVAYVCRQLEETAELACDRWVVWLLPDERRTYAEALVAVAARSVPAAAPAPSLGLGNRVDASFERRLRMLFRNQRQGGLALREFVAIGALGLLTLPAWGIGQAPQVRSLPTTPAAVRPAEVAAPTAAPAAPLAPVTAEPAAIPSAAVVATTPAASAAPVSAQAPATEAAPTPAVAPGAANRERRLAELESKIAQMLQELRSLRGAGYAGVYTAYPPPMVAPAQTLPPTTPPAATAAPQYYAPVSPNSYPVGPAKIVAANQAPPAMPVGQNAMSPYYVREAKTANADEVQMLTRASYKLSTEAGQALATFLRDHVKAEIYTNLTDDGKLVIITSPEAQQAIGQFIGLVQGTTPHKPALFPPGTQPWTTRPGYSVPVRALNAGAPAAKAAPHPTPAAPGR